MIDFPTATAVHRRLPKEAFYKHLPLTKALKDKFVSRCGKNCCREQPHKRESEPEHGFGDKGNTIAVDVFKEAGVRWQSDRGDCKAESSQAGFSAYVRG
mgnify:CR=1 FL=1